MNLRRRHALVTIPRLGALVALAVASACGGAYTYTPIDLNYLSANASEQFTITVRGKPVADLVPHRGHSAQSLEAAVHAMQAFRRIQGVADAEVASFVSEGRR